MGQWVLVPRHPSNEFFYQFKNCLVYANLNEFKCHFEYAMTHDSQPDPSLYCLSWEAAIDRLLNIMEFSHEETAHYL